MTSTFPIECYLEQAKLLGTDEAETILSRMCNTVARKMGQNHVELLEAVAFQLRYEDKQLEEWRANFSELKRREHR